MPSFPHLSFHPRAPKAILAASRILPIFVLASGFMLLAACGADEPAAPAASTDGIEVVEDDASVAEQPAEAAGGDAAVADSPETTANQQRATQIAQSNGTATAQVAVTAEARAEDNVAYDEAVLAEIEEAVSTLFSGSIGEKDPAWHDVTVRRMSTRQLAALRNQPPPPPGVYLATEGSVWVVGFRTEHVVTPDTMPVDNSFELQDVPNQDLADADGRTAVYFILSITERGSRLQYTPLARGILPAVDAQWTLADLAAME